MNAASAKRSRRSGETERAVARVARPASLFTERDAGASGALLVLLPLLVLGLLLLGASGVSPARIPWPGIAEPLYLHRSDIALLGIGAIAIALVCLNIAVLH